MKKLVKVENHYVPWDYIHQEDGTLTKCDMVEDVNARMPKITWCEKHWKWKFEFIGADIGGYDVQKFVRYYDRITDILNDMEGGKL